MHLWHCRNTNLHSLKNENANGSLTLKRGHSSFTFFWHLFACSPSRRRWMISVVITHIGCGNVLRRTRERSPGLSGIARKADKNGGSRESVSAENVDTRSNSSQVFFMFVVLRRVQSYITCRFLWMMFVCFNRAYPSTLKRARMLVSSLYFICLGYHTYT